MPLLSNLDKAARKLKENIMKNRGTIISGLDKGLDVANKVRKSLASPKVNKILSEIEVSGLTLTNNETKFIVKVIRSFENRGILLKGTTGKFTSQEGKLLNFLAPSMKVGLPLMKNILTLLAKRVLVPLGLTAAASAT